MSKVYYYLVTNDLISQTCSNEPKWLRNKRKEVNWWKITTSEDLTQSIIISEKKIDNKDNVGIAELTEADAQLLENTWHPSKEIEVLGKDGNEKVMTVPVNINSFSKNIEQIKNNIGKLK